MRTVRAIHFVSLLSFVLLLLCSVAVEVRAQGFTDMTVEFPDPPKPARVEGRGAVRPARSGGRALVRPTVYVPAARAGDWTTGSGVIDGYVRESARRNGLDPFLIFCVMNQESSFRTGAVSPKGARGLMQLMPATAARFGVRNIFDPAENIEGGAKYLRYLLNIFGDNRVDLVLASYNAGEGATIRYGWSVPPFNETAEYVRRICGMYGSTIHRGPSGARGEASETSGGAVVRGASGVSEAGQR